MDETGRDSTTDEPGLRLLVADIMSTPVVTVQITESLWVAVERFLASGVRHLVVLAGTRCAGVLSDRDIIAAWPLDPLGLRLRQVGALLHEQFPAVAPTCPVVLAARLMIDHRVDALPVVESDTTVVGVITSSDFVRMVSRVTG